MNFKDLYVSQNLIRIEGAKDNILHCIDSKLDSLNSYIIGRVSEHVDYSDITTAKQHYDNLVILRQFINVDNDKFIELDFDDLNVKLKDERINIDKQFIFNSIFVNVGNIQLTTGTITTGSINQKYIAQI